MMLNTIFIIVSVGYVFYYMTNLSANTRLLIDQPLWFKHLAVACVLLIIAYFRFKSKQSFSLGDIYLFVPTIFLLLFKLADTITLKLYDRHLILANKFNMVSEETKNANFTDYTWFVIVYLVPMILPLFLYDVVLGKKL